jgi:hypothetical protein
MRWSKASVNRATRRTGDLALVDPRLLADRADAEDPDLRVVDDRVAVVVAEAP